MRSGREYSVGARPTKVCLVLLRGPPGIPGPSTDCSVTDGLRWIADHHTVDCLYQPKRPSRQFGLPRRFGIEGTGSYGRGLASAVRRAGHDVIEVMRANRQDRHRRGKSDLLDAENAARAVLAGTAEAIPKNTEGVVEMIRHIKIAKDAAVKARTVAMQSLKAVFITAPAELRQALEPLPNMALIRRCAALRPGELRSVSDAVKHTLRAIAQRWLILNDEISGHEKLLDGRSAAT